MTITIELKPEIETYARKQASQSGIPLEDYIAFVIKEAVSQREQNGSDITKQLDDVYATQSSELDVSLQAMQAASLPPEEW
ncbi:MAG TPA: hypothetical protein VGC91_08180 [Pyrinomonadaceae bacterium]|jgi:hypothetical protein